MSNMSPKILSSLCKIPHTVVGIQHELGGYLFIYCQLSKLRLKEQWDELNPCHKTCVPQSSSSKSNTWELVRSAESQVHPTPT